MDDGDIAEILDDVRVFNVTLIPNGLVVDVYGGSHHVVSSLAYKDIPSSAELLELSQVFRRWEIEGTALAYVRFHNGIVRLVPEHDGL